MELIKPISLPQFNFEQYRVPSKTHLRIKTKYLSIIPAVIAAPYSSATHSLGNPKISGSMLIRSQLFYNRSEKQTTPGIYIHRFHRRSEQNYSSTLLISEKEREKL